MLGDSFSREKINLSRQHYMYTSFKHIRSLRFNFGVVLPTLPYKLIRKKMFPPRNTFCTERHMKPRSVRTVKWWLTDGIITHTRNSVIIQK